MSIKIPDVIRVRTGMAVNVEAEVSDSNARHRSAKWSTSDRNVVMLSGFGNLYDGFGGTVYAIKDGTAKITASLNEFNGNGGLIGKPLKDECTVHVVPVGGWNRVTLPLEGMGDGVYASTTEKPCTCHDWCGWNIAERIIPGTEVIEKCTCFRSIRYGLHNAIQCDGFARYVYYRVNGGGFSGYMSLSSYNSSGTSMNEKNLLQHLLTWGPYSYVRGGRNSDQHSIFVETFTDKTVTIYHANMDGQCMINHSILSYADFLRFFNWYCAYQYA
jgi:hypothetical protein